MSCMTNQPLPGPTMKKLLAAAIVGAFAFTGVAIAQDKKAEVKKPTAEECKKDPKMKGCEAPKK